MSYKGREKRRNMKTTTERRLRLIEILCRRRKETIENLAYEFNVSTRTIRYDIEVLSVSFPIYTLTGPYGGVYIADDYQLGMRYLTDAQYKLLDRLMTHLTGADKELLHTIIQTFRKPDVRGRK